MKNKLQSVVPAFFTFHLDIGSQETLPSFICPPAKFQKISENDQEIPQSQTAVQPTVPRGRASEQIQRQDIQKTIKVKQSCYVQRFKRRLADGLTHGRTD